MKLFIFIFLISSFVFADCSVEDSVPNKFIVRLKKPLSPMTVQSMMVTLAARKFDSSAFKDFLAQNKMAYSDVFEVPARNDFSITEVQNLPPSTYTVEVNSSADVERLAQHPMVDTVERDCLYKIQGAVDPQAWSINDPAMNQMWDLQKIQIEDAWTISRGSTAIISAVSDTGVDYNHPDLKANMWINTKETAGNGVDDDQNGCIDDIYGCDFADNTGNPMPNGSGLSHGTHVAGTVAAVGNNGVGLSGIVQVGRIMAVKGFSSTGVGDGDALLKGIYYAVNNGARVINCSWGRHGTSTQADRDAFKYAYDHGVVAVVAAGNDNMDAANFSPADLPTVVTVGASDSQDQIATFSNWGPSVEVLAPGGKGYDANHNTVDGIYSTLPNSSYGKYIGTSMAAPHVTGLVTLILSINPNLMPPQVLKILQDGGDQVHVTTYQSGKQFDYKRINAYGSAKLALASTGNSCIPGMANCSLSGKPNPSTADILAGFSQSSGCGTISSDGGSSGSGIPGALALMLLPLVLVWRLRRSKTH